MRLYGFPGLAVAVMKQAAHDYCEELRWMRDHAEVGIVTKEEIKKEQDNLAWLRQTRQWIEIRKSQDRIYNLKEQAQHEANLRKLENWFTSQEFSALSTINGESMMLRIQEQLKKDPSYRILPSDDF